MNKQDILAVCILAGPSRVWVCCGSDIKKYPLQAVQVSRQLDSV